MPKDVLKVENLNVELEGEKIISNLTLNLREKR